MRRFRKSSAFSASVMCCRKLLMHIAVSKGAKQGLQFYEDVDFLACNNFIPPDVKGWVDHIRTKGNEMNHEILLASESEAKKLIDFVGVLLKVIYEFPRMLT